MQPWPFLTDHHGQHDDPGRDWDCFSSRSEQDVRENKAITVDPVGVLGVEAHELVKQNVGDRGHAHRGTGVARVGLGGGINLEREVSMVIHDTSRHRWSSMLDEGGLPSIVKDCRNSTGERTARTRMVLIANWSKSV